MTVPANPKIYHIVHLDNLPSIVADGHIWSDAEMQNRNPAMVVGMGNIKARRLNELQLPSHPGLFVGACTPFYFCPRSVMLFLIHKRNPELTYQGGQRPIVHLEADLRTVVQWANANNHRWAFTLSNAGAYYFEDRDDLAHLGEINWQSVRATNWGGGLKEGKQAEFLIERAFPWHLVERIGVYSQAQVQPVNIALANAAHRPRLEIKRNWYY